MARIVGMPEPAAGIAVPAGRARTLAQVYRDFGEVDAAGTSPLYERVAVALSESGEAHGFRKAETIITALEAELAFYGQIMGFTPPGVAPVQLA